MENILIDKSKALKRVLDPRKSECIYMDDILCNVCLNYFKYKNEKYVVLTDSEANNYFREIVENEMDKFDSLFLEDITHIDMCVFEILKSLDEYCNIAIKCMIKGSIGVDGFLNEVKLKNGRGKYISKIDGKEYNTKVNDTIYYVYRIA